MPKVYEMPRMSDTMEEGTLIKWNVKVGDKVKAGDEVADIETDKATMPMPVYDDGVIAKLVAQAGATLKVGQPILVLALGNESVEEAAKAADGTGGAGAAKEAGGGGGTGSTGGSGGGGSTGGKQAEAPRAGANAKQEGAAGSTAVATVAPVAAPAEEAEGEAAGSGDGHLRVSPLARKIAVERGLDLSRIQGSGPESRVKRDVLTGRPVAAPATAPPAARRPAAATPAPAPGPIARLETKLIPVSNMRKTIARRLVESKTTIPHFTVTTSVNMDPLMTLRATLNQQLEAQGVKLSVNDFIVRGAALALTRHPAVNSSWTEQGIQEHGTANIGIAVSLPAEKGGGLVVPVLRDALGKGLRTISIETRALAEKARTKGLSVEEMSDGTFTISNLGMYGVEHFEAIINPPQAAILAVGAAEQKAVRGGQIVAGTEMTCTLSADHRVVDGAMAAEYLQTLKQMLENPAVLLV